jgi:hypothetical protein
VGHPPGKANEGADMRRFGAEKHCSLAPKQVKMGQNSLVLFTDLNDYPLDIGE